MKNILKLALRNLFRYKRRTLLTSSLIAFGVVLVIVFGGLAISFKSQMIGIITNTSLGDLQIHRKGYVESIDNLPLSMVLTPSDVDTIESVLKSIPEVSSYSPRLKFGAMISNYAQTSNIRLTAVFPGLESKAFPGLLSRIKASIDRPEDFIKPGEILIPENLMKGLSLKIGDEVVLVATNKDGSVNGISTRVKAAIENVLGPTGKDGYIHIEDGRTLLRMDQPEIIEVAIHLKNFEKLNKVATELRKKLGSPSSLTEVHTWEQLSPFASIARIVDLLIIVVKFILVSIVLVSVLNIMTMSVYERVSEIGTIAAIGTPPHRILSMFLAEGLFIGLLSTIAGLLIGLVLLWLLSIGSINFQFGQMNVSLTPGIPLGELLWVTLIVVLVSTLASLQPAYKAAKMEPVVALGHV